MYVVTLTNVLIDYSAVVMKNISTCVCSYPGHGASFVLPVLAFCSDQFHVFEICRPLARYDRMWTVDASYCL